MGIFQAVADAEIEFWEWMDALPITDYVACHAAYLQVLLDTQNKIAAFEAAYKFHKEKTCPISIQT